MASNTGTMRGTPNRGQGRGGMPAFTNSPASNIPRPALETHGSTSVQSDAGGSTMSASRQKQSKKDEAIRRRIETDLSKKKHATSRARQTRKAPPGTVLALRPSQALQIKPNITVAEAAQLMAAKREDCVLVTDDDDRIAGIFTAKDLAFRVVGAGIKASSVTIAEIMTKNPLCARTDTSATDALDLMVRKGFRHLPVMDENQDISGILDITKCFYDAMEKLERAYSSSRKLYDALEGVQSELGSSQPQQIIQYVEALRSKMSGPTLESVLNGTPPTTVSVRTSVKEAAALMKENHTTAVLVQDGGSITGIFTSKDVVLRVIAPGLDPANCSVVRVMTPHPDFAPMDMSIQAALRKMHDGHYLNLPVMNDAGEIVGMVDVLKLTYATLEQINTMSTGDSEGPAWNKFWLSLDNDTESVMSGEGSHHHTHHTGGRSLMSPDLSRGQERHVDASVAPGDSASHNGADSPAHSAIAPIPEIPPEEIPFPFKFKAPSGRVHRLQVIAAHGMGELIASVTAKLGTEVDAVGGAATFEEGRLGSSGYALSYLDDDGDTVSITTDHDLLEAIVIARSGHRDKVDLFVHDPEKPPISATLDPHPVIRQAPTPPASTIRERRRAISDEEDESDEEQPVRRTRKVTTQPTEQQVIAGVPNDLLLPGAMVTLAVVIVGVFALTRATSRRKALAPPLRKPFIRTISAEVSEIESSIDNHLKETHSIEANLNQLHITQSLLPPSSVGEDDTVAHDYYSFQNIKKRTRRLGTVVSKHYKPHELVVNPPKPENVTLELLMASQSHLGHSTSLWNPANQRYIFGVRQGVHIISLETTAAHLRRAAKVVEGVAYHGGLILFVGTRRGQDSTVVKAAKLAKGCHLFERWIPGSITNGDRILAKCGIKAVGPHDEELDGFDDKIAEWRSLRPDLVVVMNPLENYVLLHECGLNNIPTIGVIDTDADPTWVTYPIPANDDSLRCIQVIAGVLGRAGEEGQRKRLEAAENGEATWLPPPGLGRPDTEEEKAKVNAGKGNRSVNTRDQDDEQVLDSIKKRAGYTSPEDDEDL
ncbi:Meiotically up-regulated 70 [Hyphodiscus hymeniophilus]|uniref:Meiotically up-regulated 70 n=1 Tax=Hyphodiscus hymeniophilus TaxID=353542 RepID=A0A9P7AV57_9HELO|nr:Meiotically up-regulated 70 [Hyphodiscus hymeniophilus]